MPRRFLFPTACAALALLGLALTLSTGRTGLLALVATVGLVVAGVGLVGLARGRVGWARLHSRTAASVLTAGGLVTALLGATLSSTPVGHLAADVRSGQASAAATLIGSSPAAQAARTPAPTPASSRPSAAATTQSAAEPAAQPAAAPAAGGTALAALVKLPVKGRAAKTGYSRTQFAQAWADVDRNGCDTRNDVLRRDLTAYVLKAGTHGCLVLRGTLHDPYTGRNIFFVRGQATSTAVQIDHVVALSDAWQKGAQGWSPDKRKAFANDSLNLLAVDGPSNQRKGDGDAATWLPPAKGYRCSYVARQVAVKARYGLWVTSPERDAVSRILKTCPGQPLPLAKAFVLGGGRTESAPAPAPAPKPAPAPAPKPAPAPSAPSSPGAHLDPRFATCKDAKAHGYGPYRQGADPEYAWYRDADHDGIVCE